eukprot:4440461-Pyramimonas_sp.AAC.1
MPRGVPTGRRSSAGHPLPAPVLEKPKGTDTATPQTSRRVCSDQSFEANPALATRAYKRGTQAN